MKTVLLLLALSMIILANDFVYAGYVPEYRMVHLDRFDYDNLTHMFAAFGNPDSSGTISTGLNIDQFVSRVTANEKTKAYISIGGGGSFSFGADTTIYQHLFADTNRTMFVNKITEYLIEHNLNGVDCDIEGTPLHHPNYNSFI